MMQRCLLLVALLSACSSSDDDLAPSGTSVDRPAEQQDSLAIGDFEILIENLPPPEDLAFGPDGNMYIGDVEAGSITRVMPSLQSEVALAAIGSGVIGITFGHEGELYAASAVGDVKGVQKISLENHPREDFFALPNTDEVNGLMAPNYIAVHSKGTLYVSDEFANGGVHMISAEGEDLGLFGTAEQFHDPNGLAFSTDEAILWILDNAVFGLWRAEVGADGYLAGEPELIAEDLGIVDGIAVAEDDELFIVAENGSVLRVNPESGEHSVVVSAEQFEDKGERGLVANIAFGPSASGFAADSLYGVTLGHLGADYLFRIRIGKKGRALPGWPQ